MDFKTGVVERIVFSNSGEDGDLFYILQVKVPVSDDAAEAEAVPGHDSGRLLAQFLKPRHEQIYVKGYSASPLVAGDEIKFSGELTSYKGQAQVDAFMLCKSVPKTEEGARGWLEKFKVEGVGEASKQKVLDHFPGRLLEVLSDRDLLVTCGIPKRVAKALADGWMQVDVPTEVLEVFAGIPTFSQKMMNACITEYGSDLIDVLTRNPWRLALEIKGISFQMAEEIGRARGADPDSEWRIAAALRYVLDTNVLSNGDIAIELRDLVRHMQNMGFRDFAKLMSSLHAQFEKAEVAFIDPATGLVVCAYQAELEEAVSQDLLRLVENAPKADAAEVEALILASELKNGLELDPSQRQAAIVAITSGVSVITGGPGTGKSTTQKIILDVLNHLTGRVRLMAPTGRASSRLAQATGGRASTIHRGLKFDPIERDFKYNRYNPWDAAGLIIDEFSMVEPYIGSKFLGAIPNGARLLIVGDDQQIPSVSPGQLLADIIRSGAIPVSRLSVIHRQASQSNIIRYAAMFARGEMPEFEDEVRDVVFHECAGTEQIVEKVLEILLNDAPEKGHDPREEVMILTPMRRGDLGSEALNKVIKSAVNPSTDDPAHSVTLRGRTFSVDDKVMQIRNDYKKEVFNGSVGRIVRVLSGEETGGKVYVQFENRVREYTHADIPDLDWCWASTIHKVQGSESSMVIMITSPDHHHMNHRELVYTGHTRAKSDVAFVGSKRALRNALRKTAARRITTLVERLRDMFELPSVQPPANERPQSALAPAAKPLAVVIRQPPVSRPPATQSAAPAQSSAVAPPSRPAALKPRPGQRIQMVSLDPDVGTID